MQTSRGQYVGVGGRHRERRRKQVSSHFNFESCWVEGPVKVTQSPPLGGQYVLGRQNQRYPGAVEPLQYLRLLLPLHLPRMSASGSPRYSDVSSPADLASKYRPPQMVHLRLAGALKGKGTQQ